MQKTKGKRFERQLATILRAHFPTAVVRRASQADRAHQSDVYVTGGSRLLQSLWLEAQDARQPTPAAKLAQAERDVAACAPCHFNRLPVVVWHKLREQRVWCTLRMSTLDEIRNVDSIGPSSALVTLELTELLTIVAGVPHETEAA